MAERNHPQPAPAPDDRPPDERYQARPQAWLTQADAMARLRDEVRTAAERESLDIVAGARRNIRQVITDARRDLLVLSAQLHASLGTPVLPHGPGAGSLPEALPALGSGEAGQDAETTGPDAERNAAVRAALERAKADIDALAQELDGAELPLEPTRTAERREPAAVDAPARAPGSIVEPEASVRGVPWRPAAELTPDAHASSSGTPNRRLVAGFVAAAAILLITGLVWLWPSGPSSPAGAPPDASSGAAAPPAAPVPGEPDSAAAVPPAPPPAPAPASGVTVVVRAARPAWIRTTIDGQADLGRTYEAGETRQIQATRSVALRVGNAGAVTVSVDGSPPEVLGTEGAVVNREYMAAGAAEPAASVSPAVPAPPTPPAATDQAPAAGASPATTTAAVTPGLPPPEQPASAGPPPPADQAAAARAAQEEADALEATSVWVPEINIVTAGQEWLDAYHRQDDRAMALVSNEQTSIADERQSGERFATGLEGVQRQFDAVSVEFAGDTAIYTARMVERRTEPGAAPEEHVARVAQIWTRRGGRWQLSDVRIMSEARLGQLVR